MTTYDPHTDWGMAPVLDESGTTPKPRATPDPAAFAEFNAGTRRARVADREHHSWLARMEARRVAESKATTPREDDR